MPHQGKLSPQRDLRQAIDGLPTSSPEPIAIVGMGCRLPGAISNPSDLWEFLSAGRTGYSEFGANNINLNGFYHPNAQRPGSISTKGACLVDEDVRLFDHAFFGVSTSIATTMDPSQRKMLEVTYEAFESAGEPWERFSGSRIGVFIGNMNGDYNTMQSYGFDFPLAQASTGGSQSILSNRINHVFNLRGPSVTLDTACSSSLYALHIAVQSIRNGDCDAAIVGGCNLINAVETHALTVKLGVLSPTSTCHTFDASADGYCRAEGFGALYLRPYSDAVAGKYPIRALVRGTSVNTNGRTASISHPSQDGQESLIRQAYKNAGLSTSQTGYVECHGTGTPIGDPIEVAAVGRVFGAERQDAPLLIGSVKPNLGHSEAASGILGIMKTVLALEKGIIPATVGVKELNPNIDFEAANVQVVTQTTPWPKTLLRRASVNSFGYGGANSHCILDHESALRESQADKAKLNGYEDSRNWMLLPFSAHDPVSLADRIDAIQKIAYRYPLTNVAYTLSARMSKFHHKDFRIVQSSNPRHFLESPPRSVSKSANSQTCRLGFIFTGQGAQWEGMGSGLLEYAVFRNSIRRQDDTLRKLSFAPQWSLEAVLRGTAEVTVHDAKVSQALCTALQIGLVNLLLSWNIVAETSVGHSSGEIAASFAAGYLSEAEAIVVAYCRGLALALNAREGAMLAVGLSVEAVSQHLHGLEADIKIAAINSPSSVTVSGDAVQIGQLHDRLQSADIFSRKLHTGGNAYHSHHMLGIGARYEELLNLAALELEGHAEAAKSRRLSRKRLISTVTPDKIHSVDFPSHLYWRKNLEQPVQFARAVSCALTEDAHRIDVLIEIGPHSTLQSPLKEIFKNLKSRLNLASPVYLSTLQRNKDDVLSLLHLCGDLFVLDSPVDLVTVNSVKHGSVCVDLPHYSYNYGPPLYHENRLFRETRQRKYLRHDLLGARLAGCAKNCPQWRNVLRPKDVPWLRDHKLLPNIVLPGSAYVALGTEALAQHLDIRLAGRQVRGCFRLRSVSIRAAMQIPDDDIGLEIMTSLQPSSASPNWYTFVVSSLATGTDSWTEHASGAVQFANFSMPNPTRLDKHMDSRTIESSDWYDKFCAAGLGYGEPFSGLSDIRADPGRNVAIARVKLDSTSHLFTGPESDYYVHPAALDLCAQVAIIAVHGGHARKLSQAYIPVFIDEMTIWPSTGCTTYAKAVAQANFKGLRGAHAKIQLLNESGEHIVDIGNIRSVAYAGASGIASPTSQPQPYTRLVWKPDISTLSVDQVGKMFPPDVNPGAAEALQQNGAAPHRQLERLLDLLVHRNPSMKILEVSTGDSEITATAVKALGGEAKRYSQYVFTASQSAVVSAAQKKFAGLKGVSYHILDLNDSAQDRQFDADFDLIIASQIFDQKRNDIVLLSRLRKLLKAGGQMILLESLDTICCRSNEDGASVRNSRSQSMMHLRNMLTRVHFSGIDIALDDDSPSIGTAIVMLTTAVDAIVNGFAHTEKNKYKVYIITMDARNRFHRCLVEQLSVAGSAAVVVTLDDCDIPKGARVILCMDFRYNSLIEGGEQVFSKLQRLIAQASSFLWLTDGDVLRGTNPYAAVVTGVVRILNTENPRSHYGVFHLEQDFDETDMRLARLIVQREAQLYAGDSEREIAMYNGIPHISRLLLDNDLNSRYLSMHTPSPAIEESPLLEGTPMIADFAAPGLLSSLYFRADDSFEHPLPDNCIEVEVAAIGLNWKDIAVSTGRVDAQYYSLECAGTVTKCGTAVRHLSPGDRVYAFARGKFGTHIRIPGYHAQRILPTHSFTDMATMPVVFCTAVYALKHLARLRKGESVLIQSATGGLGLAAIQVAREIGADIYAMVGTEEKALHLHRGCKLQNDHIFISRDVASLSSVMQATGNRGFDTILSSSVGEIMHETWKCIAPRGRFIDVGRLDVQNHSDMAMQVFARNATFSSFDLSILADQDPEFVGSLMKEVDEMLKQGCISPIHPVNVFDVSALDKALLNFSKGKHLGKLVVSYEDKAARVKMQRPLPRATFDSGAVYVLVGGLGGLGRSTLQWMVERGARKLAVFTRSRQPSVEVVAWIQDYASRGASVWTSQCDVTNKEQVLASLADAATRGPIKGLIHAAVEMSDRVFDRLSHAEWKVGLSAKVQGTLNLHEASIERELPLDFFIMTSSFEAVVALPSQPAYCAANGFQDAFARYRRSQGLPGCAIAFGLITEIGHLGQRTKTRDLIYRNGLYRTGELDFLRILEAAFLPSPPRTARGPAFDTLAEAQITTCLDPSELAQMAGKNYNVDTQIPRWHMDKKFSHLLQAMSAQLLSGAGEYQAEVTKPAVTIAVDEAIRDGSNEMAVRVVVDAIIERAAALLSVQKEVIKSQNALAFYGVDSLLSVEMRSWFALLFDQDVPLLQLLDEGLSIQSLATMLVNKRQKMIDER
ncbi:hypothetical protein BDV96DRAFT_499365 [Lophiotrema nucula]|uniref:Uncharacterized protein n=1 Tax=Lophiotrema nucula TaxID=690887 RepID=A0A6A5YXA0_9PLEO|nr:hypothetical protein BDV96DRAFT_499365 [Lophiotrema nucula]